MNRNKLGEKCNRICRLRIWTSTSTNSAWSPAEYVEHICITMLLPVDARREAHRWDEEVTYEVPLNLRPEKNCLHCLESFGKAQCIACREQMEIIEISWPCSHTQSFQRWANRQRAHFFQTNSEADCKQILGITKISCLQLGAQSLLPRGRISVLHLLENIFDDKAFDHSKDDNYFQKIITQGRSFKMAPFEINLVSVSFFLGDYAKPDHAACSACYGRVPIHRPESRHSALP